jgi:hypothetical protein
MNASVNTERIVLTITGSFAGIQANFVEVLVKFPLPNQQGYFCTIETIRNDRFFIFIFKFKISFFFFSLTCNLILPKRAVTGMISINIQPGKILSIGDTDISGTLEFPEKFHVYVSVLISGESER